MLHNFITVPFPLFLRFACLIAALYSFISLPIVIFFTLSFLIIPPFVILSVLYVSSPSFPTQELQAEVNAHRQHLQRMQERGAALRKSHTWARSEVQQRCDNLAEEWEELEESLDKRAIHLNKALAREQVGTE